jgi:hypothetical protein
MEAGSGTSIYHCQLSPIATTPRLQSPCVTNMRSTADQLTNSKAANTNTLVYYASGASKCCWNFATAQLHNLTIVLSGCSTFLSHSFVALD